MIFIDGDVRLAEGKSKCAWFDGHALSILLVKNCLSGLQEIAMGQTGKWQRRRRDVASFLRSRRLTDFVEEQNAKGLAPRIGQATAALARDDEAAPLGHAGARPSFGRMKLASRVQWVRRRCHGLGLQTGVFKVGANLAIAVRRQKARWG